MTYIRRRWLIAAATPITACAAVALASTDIDGDEAPIAAALEASSEEVRVFNDHLVTLASPFCEGRLPGTRGMEIAKEYCEYWFMQAGLEPAFMAEEELADGTVAEALSYRQAFPLGGTREVTEQDLGIDNGVSFAPDRDFRVTGMGKSASMTAPAAFIGYSVHDGPDGYTNFDGEDDLTGKIAIMLRFEPMNDEGNSQWSERRWSDAATFDTKFAEAVDRNAAGIIVINPPDANDPRINSLLAAGGGGGVNVGVPVLHMSIEGGDKLMKAAVGKSLTEMREWADEGSTEVLDLGVDLTLAAKIESKSLMAENVGGLLRGRGGLEDEYIVIGAHLDHLGQGDFGSRSGPGELHPGADDNASGSAAILMLGDSLAKAYAAAPDDQPLRSVLLVCFSAEESGLNGSRYYTNNPIVPLDQHKLMINFDMIGRVTNDRLSVSGTGTGNGMKEWLSPLFAASDLEIVESAGSGGGSDHLPFMQKQIPILFGIIADFHADYHTPRDVSWKINRVGAVKTIRLFHNIAWEGAQLDEFFDFQQAGGGRRPGGDRQARTEPQATSRDQIKVRLGIAPANYNEEERGVLIGEVYEGVSADKAGIKPGDRLIRWDGRKITGIVEWMGMLAKHEPGDEVKVGVERDGKEVTLTVKLQAK